MSMKINSSTTTSLIANQINSNDDSKISNIALKTLDGTTNHWITPGNIERAGWSSLSAASAASSLASYIFYTTIAASTGSVVAALLPASLLLTAGLFAWNAYTTPNYDSTAEVAKYREEAKSLSLEEVLSRHGKWTYDRKILSQEQVTEKYLEKESSLKGLPAKIANHAKLEAALRLSGTFSFYTLPNPVRLKEEIKKECEHLSFQEIKDLHSLELIFSWNLLTPKEFSQKYQEHAWNLFRLKGISAVIADYKVTSQAPKNTDYQIPHPKVFSALWLKKDYSLEEIVLKQGVDELIIYEILQNASFISSLKKLEQEFKQNEAVFTKAKKTIENTYNSDLSRAQSQYNNQANIARMAANSIMTVQAQRNLRVSFLQGQLDVAKKHKDSFLIPQLTRDLEYAKSEKFLSTLDTITSHLLLDQRLASARKHFDEEVRAINLRRSQALSPVEKAYATKKKALENEYKSEKPKLFF